MVDNLCLLSLKVLGSPGRAVRNLPTVPGTRIHTGQTTILETRSMTAGPPRFRIKHLLITVMLWRQLPPTDWLSNLPAAVPARLAASRHRRLRLTIQLTTQGN